MRQNVLFGVMATIALVVVGYYLWAWLDNDESRSTDELTTAALHEPTLDRRESAAIELIDAGTDGTVALRRLAYESGDDQVRAAAMEGLGRSVDFESMDVLLAALDDDSATVRGRAGVVVARMLGRDRRFRADAPEEERRRIAQLYRDDWTYLKDSPNFAEYTSRFNEP